MHMHTPKRQTDTHIVVPWRHCAVRHSKCVEGCRDRGGEEWWGGGGRWEVGGGGGLGVEAVFLIVGN